MVYVLKPTITEVGLKGADAIRNLGTDALLGGEKQKIIVFHVGQELIKLLIRADVLVGSAHVPRDRKHLQVLDPVIDGIGSSNILLLLSHSRDRCIAANRSVSRIVVSDVEQSGELEELVDVLEDDLQIYVGITALAEHLNLGSAVVGA